jgi:hypothetical protein
MENKPATYSAPWQGQLILACRKCQKKLKGDPDLRALAKLKKTVKRHNKEDPSHALHIIDIPCMDLCPKSGVTICNPASVPARLSILRGAKDLQQIFNDPKARS